MPEVDKMDILDKSKLKQVSLTASRIVGFLLGIVLTGFVVNFMWYLFCALILGWGDSAPEWYIGIQERLFYGIFAGSVILWLGGAYWLRSRVRNRTQT